MFGQPVAGEEWVGNVEEWVRVRSGVALWLFTYLFPMLYSAWQVRSGRNKDLNSEDPEKFEISTIPGSHAQHLMLLERLSFDLLIFMFYLIYFFIYFHFNLYCFVRLYLFLAYLHILYLLLVRYLNFILLFLHQSL